MTDERGSATGDNHRGEESQTSDRSGRGQRGWIVDRQIAERLTVGMRIVEGHLLRTYATVCVRSRRELVALFAAATPPPTPMTQRLRPSSYRCALRRRVRHPSRVPGRRWVARAGRCRCRCGRESTR